MLSIDEIVDEKKNIIFVNFQKNDERDELFIARIHS